MARRRRCEVCDELFTADPRVGKRQHACSAKACQRERHRRGCVRWRRREAPAVEADRFRRRLVPEEGALCLAPVRDECGVKVQVVLVEVSRLVAERQRDECHRHPLVERGDSLIFVPRPPRDEMGRAGPAP